MIITKQNILRATVITDRDSGAAKHALPIATDDHELCLGVEDAADAEVAGLLRARQCGPPGPGVSAHRQKLGRKLFEAPDDIEPDPGDRHGGRLEPGHIEDTVLGPLTSGHVKCEAGEVVSPVRSLAPAGDHDAVLGDLGDVV